jgi:hypothetical protein
MEIGRGHLGGPVGWSEEKGRESVVAISRFPCGSPRLCRLRTEGLVPVNKYWMYLSHAGVYGLNKPSSRLSIKVCLFSTASLVVVGESWVRTCGSVSWCGVDYVGSPSSQRQWICSNLLTTHERLPRTRTAHRKRTPDVRGLTWESYVSCWSGFPCRVYIDSNRRDFQIWVTACSWLPSSSNLLD